MSESARVTSIEAVKEWREALCVFRAEAQEALTSVEMDIRRTFDWLDEQTRFWQVEARRWDDRVVQARAELLRRQMMTTPTGREPDTTEQQKQLRQCQERLRHAEAKVEKARQLGPVLRRAVEEYEGPGRRLAGMLDAELPSAVAMLDRKLDALDAYLSTAAPKPRAEPTSKEEGAP
ncbi:MAG: hypothetical protein K2R98_14790 [Gemmataceae bacterium]|nr:hypothetical protein [Gemmataceae bacterium]